MSRNPQPPPHIDLWDDLAVVVSALGSVAAHAHASSAFVVGLDREFHVGQRGAWRRTHGAWIPAGCHHRLECDEGLMAIIYPMGPPHGSGELLRSLRPERVEALRDHLRAAVRGRLSRQEIRNGLRVRLSATDRRVTHPARIDPRVIASLELLRTAPDQAQSVAGVAEMIGLSATRLMHLFKKELGVPFRKVRNWERLRHVVVQHAAGESLTMASLSAGYADSSHLSRAFKGMFGISASTVLNSQTRVRIADPDDRSP
ncbi:MAG: helix-turn-helix domain-containing protein [Myxococcota bacterium]